VNDGTADEDSCAIPPDLVELRNGGVLLLGRGRGDAPDDV
jgi:hypothetical protein